MIQKHPIKVSVLIDENGKLIERRIHREIDLGDPWIDLTLSANEMTMANPEAFKYFLDGTCEPLKKVKLNVSTTRFIADDEDPDEQCSVMIQGDELADDEAVEVTVDGQVMMMTKNDLYIFDSAVPGVFYIEVTDGNYYSMPKSVSVMAVAAS